MGEKWIGKDGKEYDSMTAMYFGNKAVERENEKKNLLEQQNALLMKQQNQQERIHHEMMENQKQIELAKIQHEKEMRINKLFDEVGLSYKLYQRFIEHFLKINLTEEEKTKISSLLRESEIIKENLEILQRQSNAKMNEKMVLEKINTNIISERDKRLYLKSKKISLYYGLGIVMGFVIAIILCVVFNDLSLLATIIMALIPIIISLTWPWFIKEKLDAEKMQKINKIIEENAVSLVEKIGQENYNIRNRINEIDLEAKKITEEKYISRWDEFYEYRINHYNYEIEKLLMEVSEDFESLEGVKFSMIDKSMALEEGTVEDYITYFNKIINE